MSPSTANLTTADRVKSILAASSGNFVEWFDFYICGWLIFFSLMAS